MLSTTKNSFLTPLTFLIATSVCSDTVAQNRIDNTELLPVWKRQAVLGRELSYPMFSWHKSLEGNAGRFGWVKSGQVYQQLGLLTWQADFVIQEIRSNTEAILEVHITQSRSDQPNRDGTVTRSRFLFRGFEFDNLAAGDLFEYSGGIVKRDAHGDGELTAIEPAVFAPLPKHIAELGLGIRTWKDDTGRYSVDAALDKIQDDKVRLVKEDGQAIEVLIAKLSEKDQLVVENRRNVRPPAPRPRRLTSRRSTSRPRRQTQSFSEGLSQRIRQQVTADLARDIYIMRQGMYQTALKMQNIQNQVKWRMQMARSRRWVSPIATSRYPHVLRSNNLKVHGLALPIH